MNGQSNSKVYGEIRVQFAEMLCWGLYEGLLKWLDGPFTPPFVMEALEALFYLQKYQVDWVEKRGMLSRRENERVISEVVIGQAALYDLDVGAEAMWEFEQG